MIKRIFWLWFIFMLALNIIPLGDSVNRTLHKKPFQGWDFFRLDYLAHFAAFLVFAGIFCWAQYIHQPVFKDRPLLKYALLVISAAILFEGLQYFIPCRKFNPIDMILNLAGALMGCLIVFISHRLLGSIK